VIEKLATRLSALVTRHDVAVVLLVVALTAGVAAGIPQLDFEDQTDIDDEVFETTEVGKGVTYLENNYSNDGVSIAWSSVYVRPEDGNALSREWLLAALDYQAAVLAEPAVERELADEEIRGPPTLVGTHLAGENATIEQQRAAIANATEDELAAAIAATLTDRETAAEFLPRSYEPGGAKAESMRVRLPFEQAGVTQQQEPLPDEAVEQVLYETTQDRPAMFTMGSVAAAVWEEQQIQDVFWLIVPLALLLVLAVLAVAYRDIVDVLLGFVGVCVSLVWFFGMLGWLGIPAGFASIVGPVLIVALSIDFGLHVFMRYREESETLRVSNKRTGSEATREQSDALRASESRTGSEATREQSGAERQSAQTPAPAKVVRTAMQRSTSAVTVAFLLVAVTAGIGFLANVTSPIGFIRSFGVVITLGVLAAVLVFVTLVPALKVRIDATLERHGIDRRRAALGTGGILQPLLSTGVDVARRGAVIVLVVALVVGTAGTLAFAELDRQGFQEEFADDDNWQTELPEPFGWSAHETPYRQNLDYVQANYQSDVERDRATTLLIRGGVTETTALERVHAATQAANNSPVTFRQGGTVPVVSPLSLLRTTAAEDEEFAALVNAVAAENDQFAALLDQLAAEDETLAAALADAPDTPPAWLVEHRDSSADGLIDGSIGNSADGPIDGSVNDSFDRKITVVYDALYNLAPEEAAGVLEHQDGQYRSMRVVVPVQQGLDVNEQGAEMHAIAETTEGESDLDVVPVGFATVSNAGLGEIADSILQTMLLAFGGVALVLAGTTYIQRGRPSLGVITVVPIALVVGLVFGTMYVFGVPLTFVTAFLVSITIGLGIDYSIHVSERFAQELDGGTEPVAALYTTVQGTGGALFGSALTSGAAFSTLLLHPSPVFQSFGLIVVGALFCSFAVSVLVFPSLLLWWARR